jgi:hypothetical protein
MPIFGDLCQFSAIYVNFRLKNWCFYQNTKLFVIFLQKLAVVGTKKPIFAKFLGDNIFFEIITSVPGT